MRDCRRSLLLVIIICFSVLGAGAVEYESIDEDTDLKTVDNNADYELTVKESGKIAGGIDSKSWVESGEIGDSKYNLSLTAEGVKNIGELERGNYELIFEGGGEKYSVQLQKTGRLRGKVTDSAGNGLETRINLGEQEVKTDYNGLFDLELSESSYKDISFTFLMDGGQRPVMRLKNPKIGGSEYLNDFIRADYFENPELSKFDRAGIEPLSLSVFKSGFQKDKVEAKVPFPAKTDDIVVYECSKWIFSERECDSEWQKIGGVDSGKVSVDYTGGSTGYWRAQVSNLKNVESKANLLLSGVMVAKESKLEVKDFEMNESIFRGQEALVEGRIEDVRGNPASNFEFNLTFSGPETETLNTKTDSEGRFEVSKVGRLKGDYEINATATRQGKTKLEYQSNQTLNVELKRSIDIDYSKDDNSVIVTKPSEVEIGIRNDGQATLTDVKLNLSGVEERFYDEKITEFSSLGPSQLRNAVIEFEIPQEGMEEIKGDLRVSANSIGGEKVEDTQEISIDLEYMRGMNPDSIAGEDPSQEDNRDGGKLTAAFSNSVSFQSLTGSFIIQRPSYNVLMVVLTTLFFSLSALLKVRRPSKGSGGKIAESDQASKNTPVEQDRDSFYCESTGKQFDTKEGLELHKELNGIEN